LLTAYWGYAIMRLGCFARRPQNGLDSTVLLFRRG
jgi:hypothetical protein